MVKAVLIKPLDGLPEGTEREFDKPDFERLKNMDAVREVSDEPAIDADPKAAPVPSNKMAQRPANKAAPTTRRISD